MRGDVGQAGVPDRDLASARTLPVPAVSIGGIGPAAARPAFGAHFTGSRALAFPRIAPNLGAIRKPLGP